MCSQAPKYLCTAPSHKNLRHALVPPLYVNRVWVWWVFMLQTLLSIVGLKMSTWIINYYFNFSVTNVEYSVGNVISNHFFLLQQLLSLPIFAPISYQMKISTHRAEIYCIVILKVRIMNQTPQIEIWATKLLFYKGFSRCNFYPRMFSYSKTRHGTGLQSVSCYGALQNPHFINYRGFYSPDTFQNHS